MLRLIQLLFPYKQVIVTGLAVVSLSVRQSNVFKEFRVNVGEPRRSRLDKPLRMTTGLNPLKFRAGCPQSINKLSTGYPQVGDGNVGKRVKNRVNWAKIG